MRWSQTRQIEGMEVRVFENAAVAADVFAKAGDALRLIAINDPNRYARLKRDLRRVLFTFSSGGQYLPRLDTCRIGIQYATRSSALELAMMIVHEATHARLWRAGCQYDGGTRERVERICVDAEIAFASRIHGAEHAIARTRQLLETRWWTHEAHVQRSAEELRALGCPQWFVRLLGFGRTD